MNLMNVLASKVVWNPLLTMAARAAAGNTGSSGMVSMQGGSAAQVAAGVPELVRELGPLLPAVASELLPGISERLLSRLAARAVRDLYV